MKVGDIIRHDGWVGVVTGINPKGKAACLLGSENNRFSLFISPSAIKSVEIIDLDRDELANALALMQAFARELVENNEPF
jgi:hypothetical protein